MNSSDSARAEIFWAPSRTHLVCPLQKDAGKAKLTACEIGVQQLCNDFRRHPRSSEFGLLHVLWHEVQDRIVSYFKLSSYISGSNSAVECQLPKLDVAGSIPVSRSNLFYNLHGIDPKLGSNI
jgi:hypothetical protein